MQFASGRLNAGCVSAHQLKEQSSCQHPADDFFICDATAFKTTRCLKDPSQSFQGWSTGNLFVS
jgi:hypothetical protein